MKNTTPGKWLSVTISSLILLIVWHIDAYANVSTNKTVYTQSERVIVHFRELPGFAQDWITIVKTTAPANTYEELYYTNGQRNGSIKFKNTLSPGKYEVRVYYNWPEGGYEIQEKAFFEVVKSQKPLSAKQHISTDKSSVLYTSPTLNNYPLNECLSYRVPYSKRVCGKPVADKFCELKGYGESSGFKTSGGHNHTFVIDEGEMCSLRCGGMAFTSISCSTAAATLSERYWGAIAFSRDTGGWGYSWKKNSKNRAEQRAIRECTKQNWGCKLQTSFSTCGAIATGPGGAFGWGTNEDIETAKWEALTGCKQYAKRKCKLLAQVCADGSHKWSSNTNERKINRINP